MKNTLKNLTAGVAAFSIFTASIVAANPAGYIDFGSFSPEVGEEYVEVDINKGLLKLASTFAKHEDPEVAEIISNLERVRVNVFGMDDSNRTDVTNRIETVRTKLDEQGWARVVTVREKGGDNVAVFVKQNDDESIHGLVVTVIGGNGEAVLVNVVGDVKLNQIAKLGERLDIDPLRELGLEKEPMEI